MYICVDFDGTVVTHEYPEVGNPIPGAIEWLKAWRQRDAQIILWTMRSGDKLKDAVDYFEKNRVNLYGVNKNPDQLSWTDSPKAYGQVYVDDAAFGCPLIQPAEGRPFVDWSVVGPAVNSMLVR